MRTQHDTPTRHWYPDTVTGRVSVALAAGFGALFAWVMFLDPLVGALMGQETTGITDSWLTPLLMVLLVDAAAVTGAVAYRAGERHIVAQVALWVSLPTGALWTLIVVGTFLGSL
jgi:hypothetical protein